VAVTRLRMPGDASALLSVPPSAPTHVRSGVSSACEVVVPGEGRGELPGREAGADVVAVDGVPAATRGEGVVDEVEAEACRAPGRGARATAAPVP
jgi:hypothetical protein